MQNRQRLFALITVYALLAGAAFAQEGATKSRGTTVTAAGSSPEADRGPAEGGENQFTNLLAQARPQKGPAFSLMPSFSITPMAVGPNLQVLGSGIIGRLTKWTGFTSSNSFIGDSTIFESKDGLVGVGTDSPTSKLTVAGTIQLLSGGFRFPDGTLQTTSAAGALTGVAHDATLTGNGTAASPLSVASPLEVRDLDNPARQPVQFALTGTETFKVPAGKRLVIEYVSVFTREVPSPSLQDVQAAVVWARVGSIQLAHVVILHRIEVTATHYHYAGGQVTRVYADPESDVFVGSSGLTITNLQLRASGHYVDVP